MLCCLVLVLLSQRLSKAIPPGSHQITGWRDPQDSLHSRIADVMLIVLALLLLLPPLMAVIVDGVNLNLVSVLQQPVLWQATDILAHRTGCRAIVCRADHDAAVEQSRTLCAPRAKPDKRWS